MSRTPRTVVLVLLAAALVPVVDARGERRARAARAAPVGAGGTVNLPYQIPDGAGNNWMIYPNGMVRMTGNMPLFNQAALLAVNGQQAQNDANRGRVDPRTQELVIEGLTADAVAVTRRLKASPDGTLRIVDVIQPAADADVGGPVELTLQSNVTFGINGSHTITDPRTDAAIGWACQTGAGRAVLAAYALRGSKLEPTVVPQPDMNMMTGTLTVPLARGKPVAIVHVHGSAATPQAAADLIERLDPRKYLADLPPDVRKAIVNAPSASGVVGDVELPRDPLTDVVELRTGDRLTGTVRTPAYTVETDVGPMTVPAERMLGLVSVGQFRPRQLLVLADGQVVGGTIAGESLEVQLASGQVVNVPLARVARVGYRLRTDEPEEPALAAPYVQLRGGDRIAIRPDGPPVELSTPFGPLRVERAGLGAIVAGEDGDAARPHALLPDGSRFPALPHTAELPVTLPGDPPRAAALPVSAVARAQFNAVAEPDPATTPVLKLLGGGGELVGTVGGTLHLHAAFDVIELGAAELRGIDRAGEAGTTEVRVTTWDGASVTGQLRERHLSVTTRSGLTVDVPVALVGSYAQPVPRPSSHVLERIRAVVKDLDAADWKQRDRAEAQLVAMGPSVAGVLRELRPGQPAEVQQRIDSVLRQVEENQPARKGPGVSVPNDLSE